jgi:hypothetical protein
MLESLKPDAKAHFNSFLLHGNRFLLQCNRLLDVADGPWEGLPERSQTLAHLDYLCSS